METGTEIRESLLTKQETISLESASRAAVSICTLYDSAGEDDIEEMKELAEEGEGLTRFINDFRPGYARRER